MAPYIVNAGGKNYDLSRDDQRAAFVQAGQNNEFAMGPGGTFLSDALQGKGYNPQSPTAAPAQSNPSTSPASSGGVGGGYGAPTGTPPATSPTPGTPGFSADARNQWQYDPTKPSRSIQNVLGLLGLPTYGPLGDFAQRYGQIGSSAAVASGDFATPDRYKQALLRQFQGQTLNPQPLLANLSGAERMARQALGEDPTLNLGDLFNRAQAGDQAAAAKLLSIFGGSLDNALRAAYVTAFQDSPRDLATLFSQTAASGGMSLGLSDLLSSFLGQSLGNQYNQGNVRNNGLTFLNSLIGGA